MTRIGFEDVLGEFDFFLFSYKCYNKGFIIRTYAYFKAEQALEYNT